MTHPNVEVQASVVPEGATFPDLYADGIQVASGPYGLALTFLLSSPERPEVPGFPIFRVRLGQRLAEAIADILKQAVAQGDARPSTTDSQEGDQP